MDGLGVTFIALAALCVLLVLILVALAVRRFQLSSALGTFDASLSRPPSGWHMGVCRYTDRHLEWLAVMSLSPRPRYRYLRSSLELRGWREPTEQEKTRIQPGAVVVLLEYEGAEMMFAMKYEVYAGLSSWLEAGPVVGVGTWR